MRLESVHWLATWVVVEIRVPLRILVISVPYYIGDPRMDPNLENYPHNDLHLAPSTRSLEKGEKHGSIMISGCCIGDSIIRIGFWSIV